VARSSGRPQGWGRALSRRPKAGRRKRGPRITLSVPEGRGPANESRFHALGWDRSPRDWRHSLSRVFTQYRLGNWETDLRDFVNRFHDSESSRPNGGKEQDSCSMGASDAVFGLHSREQVNGELYRLLRLPKANGAGGMWKSRSGKKHRTHWPRIGRRPDTGLLPRAGVFNPGHAFGGTNQGLPGLTEANPSGVCDPARNWERKRILVSSLQETCG